MLRRVTICEEESPYKPETTLLYVRSRSKNTIALIIAPKELAGSAINYLMIRTWEVQEDNSSNDEYDCCDSSYGHWVFEEDHS